LEIDGADVSFETDLLERALEDVRAPGGVRRFADLIDRSRIDGTLDFIETAYEIARRDGAVIVELLDGNLLIRFDGEGFTVSELD